MTPEQKERNFRLAKQLLAEQNFRNALVLGLLATLASAAIWIMLAASTGQTAGYLAIGLGAVVGYTVQVAGKGIQTSFVLLATGLAILGSVLGNAGAAIMVESVDHQMPVTEIFSSIPAAAIVDFIISGFGLLDMGFWILAVSAAGYIAKRRLTRPERLAIFTLKYSSETG